jgi:hypothetical protein
MANPRIKLKGFGEKATNPLVDYLNKTYPRNPLDPREFVIDDETAITVVPHGKNRAYVDSIRAFEKRTGSGTRVLDLLGNLADEFGTTLEGFAEPFGQGGPNKKQLIEIYKKRGWVEPPKGQEVTGSGTLFREPRPPDQPNLPALLGPPGEPGKKPSKGGIFRGIGSLMRRRMFPLIQAAQAGWGMLSPEAKAEVEAFLKRPAHELVGMEKPGIESFKELLGISPEDLGETIPLPGPEPSQRISSKDTSIKQIAAVFKKPEIFDLKEGSVNLDIGGGRFDLGTDYLRNERGVENLVFDRFNRSPEHNEEVLNRIRETGGADSATAANILNVIEEPEARKRVIQQSYDYTREGGKVFFQVYEGSGTGVGRGTTKGWQNNKKTSEYIPEIEGIFGEGNVQRKGNIIIAIKEGSSPITIPDLAVNKAAGGFIDKPLYDNLIAPSRGSFIDKPLYEGAY